MTYRALTASVLGASSGLRLLDDRADRDDAVGVGVARRDDDPVAAGLRSRDVADRDRADRAVALERRAEAGDDRRLLARAEDAVPERDGEHPVADAPLGLQHGVAEAARDRLDDRRERHPRRLPHEVLLDRLLARRGDEHDAIDAARGQLLDDVLDDRPASDRQHLLRQRARRRAQPRAAAGDGHDRRRQAHPGVSAAPVREGRAGGRARISRPPRRARRPPCRDSR